MAYLSLFISAFTSATLLPGSSEALFLLLLAQESYSTGVLILTAGTGNSLGGMTNWVLGLLIRNGLFKSKKYAVEDSASKDSDSKKTASKGSAFKGSDCKDMSFKERQHIRAEQWFQKYGSPALLFSFLPIIGDPLCLVAGFIKIHWLKALLFISIGKFFRYYALSYFPT